MAIDINNGLGPLAQGGSQATQRNRSEDATKTSDAAEGRDARSNEVKISDDAQSMREMQARLERQESFDEARVAEIRNAISEGQYPIDNQRLAEKFLQLESKL